MDKHHELAFVLLGKAKDDFVMASRLAGDPEAPDWGIGFHVQQAVEKAIKAVLSLKSVEYPRTHNIRVVTNLLRTNEIPLPPDHVRLAQLTPYGVVFRYDEVGPSDDELAAMPDRTALLSLCEAVIVWAQRILGAHS